MLAKQRGDIAQVAMGASIAQGAEEFDQAQRFRAIRRGGAAVVDVDEGAGLDIERGAQLTGARVDVVVGPIVRKGLGVEESRARQDAGGKDHSTTAADESDGQERSGGHGVRESVRPGNGGKSEEKPTARADAGDGSAAPVALNRRDDGIRANLREAQQRPDGCGRHITVGP